MITKFLNVFFAGVYTLILVVTAWSGGSLVMARTASMLDAVLGFIFVILYVGAFLFSIFMHLKLRNQQPSLSYMCLGMTTINFVLFVGLIIIVAFSHGGDGGIVLLFWFLLDLVLWFFSMILGIFGIVSIKKE